MSRTREYTLKRGVKVRTSVPHKKVPFDVLKSVTVERANKAEFGPVQYFGAWTHGARFKVLEDGDSIKFVRSKRGSRPRRKRKNALPPSVCRPLEIKARWLSAADLPTHAAGSSGANVFGASGLLHVRRRDALSIPMVSALDCEKMLYERFGIEIIPFGQPLPTYRGKEKLFMVTYRINAHFASKYVHSRSGPGLFLEHHHFPHYMTPSSRDSRNPFIVGRFTTKRSKSRLELVGVTVPFGYTLYLPPDMIHTDWYFIGNLTTSLRLDQDADTVFVRGLDSKKIPLRFSFQVQPSPP